MPKEVLRFILVLSLIIGLFLIFSLNKIEKDETIFGKAKAFFSPNLEKKQVEIQGNIETIIVDDFENEKSETMFFLNKDGKRYKLELKDTNNVPFRGTIKGIFKDNTITVENIKPSLIRDFDSSPPNWPKTLGDQKYVVVYLFNNTEPHDEIYNLTNITFNSSNNFIVESSYGKASVSVGYIHQDILPENISGDIDILNYAVLSVDPHLDFLDYDGILVFYPDESSWNRKAFATLGKIPILTNEGEMEISVIWGTNEVYESDIFFAILIHEMGHNFGLDHASSFECGEYPNRVVFGNNSCYLQEYGDYYDIMGHGMEYLQDFGLRNKNDILGWIDDSNVLEVDNGTFFVSNFENDSTGTSNIQGLKIPILWNSSKYFYLIPEEESRPLTYVSPLTFYYLEYRKTLLDEECQQEEIINCENETTYGLNLSDVEGGIFVRIGGENSWVEEWQSYTFFKSFLFGMHPNSRVCQDNVCSTDFIFSNYFAFLSEGETYYDNPNKMKITFLEANESGALVQIKKQSSGQSFKCMLNKDCPKGYECINSICVVSNQE